VTAAASSAQRGAPVRRRERLSGVSLRRPTRGALGLVGPDGAGKDDADPRAHRAHRRRRRGGRSSNGGSRGATPPATCASSRLHAAAVALYGDLSVDENLRFFGHLFGISRRDFQEAGARGFARHHAARAREGFAGGGAVGGMYKKLAIACASSTGRARSCSTSDDGVDPVSRRECGRALRIRGRGMGVLVSTPTWMRPARCGRCACWPPARC